jgi:hypothetical protein
LLFGNAEAHMHDIAASLLDKLDHVLHRINQLEFRTMTAIADLHDAFVAQLAAFNELTVAVNAESAAAVAATNELAELTNRLHDAMTTSDLAAMNDLIVKVNASAAAIKAQAAAVGASAASLTIAVASAASIVAPAAAIPAAPAVEAQAVQPEAASTEATPTTEQSDQAAGDTPALTESPAV